MHLLRNLLDNFERMNIVDFNNQNVSSFFWDTLYLFSKYGWFKEKFADVHQGRLCFWFSFFSLSFKMVNVWKILSPINSSDKKEF